MPKRERQHSESHEVKVIGPDGAEIIVRRTPPMAKSQVIGTLGQALQRLLRENNSRARPPIALRPGMPFKELEEALQRLGFRAVHPAEKPYRVYREEIASAIIVLPHYQQDDAVRSVHISAIRKLLAEKGLAKPSVLIGQDI